MDILPWEPLVPQVWHIFSNKALTYRSALSLDPNNYSFCVFCISISWEKMICLPFASSAKETPYCKMRNKLLFFLQASQFCVDVRMNFNTATISFISDEAHVAQIFFCLRVFALHVFLSAFQNPSLPQRHCSSFLVFLQALLWLPRVSFPSFTVWLFSPASIFFGSCCVLVIPPSHFSVYFFPLPHLFPCYFRIPFHSHLISVCLSFG